MAALLRTTNGNSLINTQYVAKVTSEAGGKYFTLYAPNLEVMGMVSRDVWLKYLEFVKAEA